MEKEHDLTTILATAAISCIMALVFIYAMFLFVTKIQLYKKEQELKLVANTLPCKPYMPCKSDKE